MTVEFRDIEVFLVMAQELHFRRAAQRLHVSPARVSQVVAALEAELGGDLFVRSSRQVRLSELGEVFRADAAEGLACMHAAISRARITARSRRVPLVMGYSIAVDGGLACRVASAGAARNPDVEVLTAAQCSGDAFETLQRGTIDILLTWSPGGDTAAVSGDGRRAGAILMQAPRAVVVRNDHVLAGADQVSIEQIAAEHTLLDIDCGGPAVFRDAWTPSRTPEGTRIPLVPDPWAAHRDGPASVLDVMLSVRRCNIPYLGLGKSVPVHTHPGLTLIPVCDLPPCVLVPVWIAENETRALRAFARSLGGMHAARPAAAGAR
ncbi:LysR family transcriptional regulator [Nocardia carnea]|uniref:LysR family transcriptional regulator n=1 Tax=Nocardia carnea TaxID=37328 RepID=UPI0024570AFF|nr:LysR family transcriptional regulator [Nocardia carnea]